MEQGKAGRFVAGLSRLVTVKCVCILLGVAFLVSLVPLLWVGRYAYPLLDDYVFGQTPHAVYGETGSVWQALVAAGGVSKAMYTIWQGTYVACFVFAAQPGIFGADLYAFTTPIMLLALCGGTFFFVWQLATRMLQLDGWTAGLIGFILLFLSVHQVPDANQAFYWYNSAAFYVLFHGLALCMFGLLIQFLYSVKHRRWVALPVASLLAFLVAGGNYVTGLMSICGMGFMLVCLVVLKRWQQLALISIPFVILCAGFAVSMAAPGTGVRQGEHLQMGIVWSMAEAFKNTFVYFGEWMFWGVWLGMIALCPVLWYALRGTSIRFRLPGLLTAGSVCLLAAGMFPHIYATTQVGPERLTNILFFTFLLLLVANLCYWLGWLRRKLGAPKERAGASRRLAGRKLAGLALLGVALVMVHFVPGTMNKRMTYVEAAAELASGEAQRYGAGMAERFALAEGAAQGEDLEVPVVAERPALLSFDDGTLGEDTESWINTVFAAYFDLGTVREESP